MNTNTVKQIFGRLANELQELARINPNRRPWHLPLAAALSAGLPLFIGVYFNHLNYGLISSLGGMTFLHMPPTRMAHRMVTLLTVSALMTAGFFSGLVVQHIPGAAVPMVIVLTILITMLCRYVKAQPPGSMFFLMSAMIAVFMPHTIEQIPTLVGLMFLGALLACTIAFIYSVFSLWRGAQVKEPPEPERDFKVVAVDSVIIGVLTGLSLLAAQLLHMPKPYWVPVTCIAVMQGITFRAVWTKQAHRIIGTAVGLILAWLLLSLHPHGWLFCLMMMSLNFIIELLVVRHYAAAVVFITPLTIFLAEAGSGGSMDTHTVTVLVQSRFYDTLLGCIIGLLGAFCLHYTGLREGLERCARQVRSYGRSGKEK